MPLRTPWVRTRRSPASPSRRPRTTGIPPATAASNSKMAALLVGQRQQRRPTLRNDLLVRGDHRLPRRECPPNPVGGRIDSADELDHDIGIGGHHLLEIVRPDHVRRYPVDSLPLDAAVGDVGESQPGIGPRAQDAGHRLPDRAESHEGDLEQICPDSRVPKKKAIIRRQMMALESRWTHAGYFSRLRPMVRRADRRIVTRRR